MKQDDDPSLSELLEQQEKEKKAQEKKAQDEKEEAQIEELNQKYQERPDWWTTRDLLIDNSASKLEGFLANDEMLQRETVNIVFGEGGSFKTWLMMQLMECVILGIPFAGVPTKKARCLFFSMEMSRSQITRRAERLYGDADAHGDLIAWRFHDPDQPLDFYNEKELSKKLLTRHINYSNSPDIVIIDALVDVMTAEEQSNREVGIVLRSIRDVAIKTQTCIIIIDHSGKPNEFRKGSNRVRGASVKRDVAADMLLVESVGTAQKPKSLAEWTKHRDLSIPVYPFNFTLDPDEHSDKLVMTFDLNPASQESQAIKANAEKMAQIVSEMATSLNIPVPRPTLRARMLDGEKWARRRFDETLAYMSSIGIIEKTKDGKESFYRMTTPNIQG